MARRHTSGFEILGFGSDPTPGDPDLITTQIVPVYTSIGDDAQSAVDALRGNAMQSGAGSTMTQLRKVIGEEYPPKLQETADSFHQAAKVYVTYAQALTDAQDQLDRAMDQASPVAATAATVVPTPPADATPDQISATATQQQQVAQASATLTAAKRLAQDAKDLRDQAGATFSKNLDDVSTVPPRSLFQKFLDFFEHSPLIQILIDVAVALVTVFFPVAGFALGVLAFAATTVLNTVATGHFDVGAFVGGLVGVALGGVGLFGKFLPSVTGFLDGLASRTPVVGALFRGASGPAQVGLAASARQVATNFATGFGIHFGIGSVVGLTSTGIEDGIDHKQFTGAQAAEIFGGAAVAGGIAGAGSSIQGRFFPPKTTPASEPETEPVPFQDTRPRPLHLPDSKSDPKSEAPGGVPNEEPPPAFPEHDDPPPPFPEPDDPPPPFSETDDPPPPFQETDDPPPPFRETDDPPPAEKPLPPLPEEVTPQVASIGQDSLGQRGLDVGLGLAGQVGGGLADAGIAQSVHDDSKGTGVGEGSASAVGGSTLGSSALRGVFKKRPG